MHLVKYVAGLRSVPVTLLITLITLMAFTSEGLTAILENHLQHQNLFSLPQIFGCHLLHWSGEHLWWDLSMFALLGWICERWLPRVFYATLLASGLAIPLAVGWSAPDIEVYRGLSGLDTAIFALLVTSLWLQATSGGDRWQAILLAILYLALWGKIAFEFYSGQLLFVQQFEFVPLPVAHAVGGLVGSACALWTAIIPRTSLGNPLSNEFQRGGVDTICG